MHNRCVSPSSPRLNKMRRAQHLQVFNTCARGTLPDAHLSCLSLLLRRSYSLLDYLSVSKSTTWTSEKVVPTPDIPRKPGCNLQIQEQTYSKGRSLGSCTILQVGPRLSQHCRSLCRFDLKAPGCAGNRNLQDFFAGAPPACKDGCNHVGLMCAFPRLCRTWITNRTLG